MESRSVYFEKENSETSSSSENQLENSPKITGVVEANPIGKSTEFIKIGVCLRATYAPKTNNKWSELIEKIQPIDTNRESTFKLTKNCWFGNGKTLVIKTAIHTPTRVKIKLDASALLSTGFTLEVYLRYINNIKQFKPNENLSAGCELNFTINWLLIANPQEAVPTLRVEHWGPFSTKKRHREEEIKAERN